MRRKPMEEKKKVGRCNYGKVLSFVTLLVLMWGMGTGTLKVQAENLDYTQGDWVYRLEEENLEATIVSYQGTASRPSIPETINYTDGREFKVTGIGTEAFRENRKIVQIVIPDTITTIGYGAFKNCDAMVSVTIGNGVTTWDTTSRYNDDYHYRHEANSAFEGCTSLTALTIKNGVTAIGTYAFYGCNSLTSVTIPETVESTGEYAFSGCTKLTRVSIANGSIGTSVFEGCAQLSQVTLGKVPSIGDGAFKSCVTLQTVTFPEELESIGNAAFSECTLLRTIDIPDKVTTIGYGAFYKCTKLASVTIGSGVTTWNNSDYYNIYHDREYVSSAFEGCISLKTLVVKDGVTGIGSYAFNGCTQLQSVELPNSVTDIGSYAFNGCSDITLVHISNGAIGDYAFNGCNAIEDLKIENSVRVGDYAFSGCEKVKELVLPKDLTYIGDEAFKNLKKITSVVIPDNVTTIGYGAFANCEELKTLVIGSGVETWNKTPYRNDYHDRDFESCSFEGCTSLKDVTVRHGVKSIGSYAFYNCAAITKIDLPASVTTVAKNAFAGCTSLKEATIRTGEIGASAFENCTGMEQLSLSGTTKIEEYAFKNCPLITQVVLPATVTKIEREAFYGTGLKEICIPNAVLTIGSGAFARCTSMTDAIIGSAVTTWDNGDYKNEYLNGTMVNAAFFGDTALKNVYFCDGIDSIGSYAFGDCTGLEKVYIPSTVVTYQDGCFDKVDTAAWQVLEDSKQLTYAQDNGYNYAVVKDISKADITISAEDYVYTGSAYTPEVKLEYQGIQLVEGTDYRVVYYNNVDVGAATVLVIGMGDYGNTTSDIFLINGRNMETENLTAQLEETTYTYTGEEIQPNILIKDGDNILTYMKDYTLSYSDNVNVGTVEVTVVGIGNYSGMFTTEFTITPANLSEITPKIERNSYVYIGKEITPGIVVTYGETTLEAGKDYNVSYKDNVNVGTATYTVEGIGNYTGSVSGEFTITKADISNATVTLKKNSYEYTGSEIIPEIVVKIGGVILNESTDYVVAYTDNIQVGTASVEVTGINNYSGTLTKNFMIKEAAKVTPTKAPVITQKPTVTSVPTKTPSKQPKAGTVIKNKAGESYKVVKAKATVSYVKPKNSKITSVNIPATVTIDGTKYKVTGIEKNAFKNLKKLKKVTIGSNVTSIGSSAFYNCKNLKNITIKTTKLTDKSIGSKSFKNINGKASIKVPKSKVNSYKKILKKKGIGSKVKVTK